MTDIPRRQVEPLDSPSGQFDVVLGRARQRRQHRAAQVLTASAVFLAGVGGGMSIDGGVSSVPQALVRFATNDAQPPSAPAPAGSTATSASVTPEVTPTRERRTPGAAPTPKAAATVAPRAPLAVRGRAVAPGGSPVAGLFVYAGEPGQVGFVRGREPLAVTEKDGSFSLPCPGTPVLLAPWPLDGTAGGLAATAEWAPTFVGGATQPGSAAKAPCNRRGRVSVTVVQRGSAMAGTADVPTACDDGRALRVWLYDDRTLAVRVDELRDGAEFRVAGLPPGRHTVLAAGNRTTVTVGGGATAVHDVTFGCNRPEPSPSPTESATPSTTSPTPLPTSSVTQEPSPTPTETSSPSPTPTGSAAISAR